MKTRHFAPVSTLPGPRGGLFLLLFGNRRLTRFLGGFSAETVVLMLPLVFLLEATGVFPARVTRGVLFLPRYRCLILHFRRCCSLLCF